MKRIEFAAIAAVALMFSACASNPSSMSGDGMMNDGMMSKGMKMDRASTMSMMSSWPMEAKKAAMAAMDKYGAPDEATETMLVWHNNGPWKRSMVYKKEVPHDFPMPHIDVWEQVIDYRVPTDKFDDLAAYDGSVVVDRTQGEMSARCDKEAANFLALNLADDIVNGRRSTEEARQFYADTIKAKMEGRSSPYLEGLRFSPMRATNDRDMAAMPKMR